MGCYRPQWAKQKQRIVEMATATPNGSFSNSGLSREILGLARKPKEIKPRTRTPRLRKVSTTRRVRIISTKDISPETMKLPSRTNKNRRVSKKAPTERIKF